MPILAEDLQRLLTTSQQRAQIDHERWQAKQPITQKQDESVKVENDSLDQKVASFHSHSYSLTDIHIH